MEPKNPSETWFNAYSHLSSKALRAMLTVDDGSRPERTNAIKYLLSQERIARRRIARGAYVEYLL